MRTKDNSQFTTRLDNLCNCDFIRKYSAFGKTERDTLYQLTDMFTLFYIHFVKGAGSRDEHLWSNLIDSPRKRTWSGYAFEQLCLHHIPQIKNTLGISGIQSDVCSWLCVADGNHKGAQIDLVIDRRDQVVNLCEMKYATGEYEITGKYEREMQERRELFRSETSTRKALHLTMVTTYGIKKNSYSDAIQSEVKLEDLFRESR